MQAHSLSRWRSVAAARPFFICDRPLRAHERVSAMRRLVDQKEAA